MEGMTKKRFFFRVVKNKFAFAMLILEKYSLAISLSFFVLGIILTAWLPRLGQGITGGIDFIISIYGYFVPFLLYFLLTPSLIKIFELSKEYGNGWLISVLRQFFVARVLAALFTILVLSLILGLPVHINGGTTLPVALQKVGQQLIHALFLSPFLYGVYASIVTIFLAKKFSRLKLIGPLHKIGEGIEFIGEYLIILSPLFMFAIGSFLYHLPVYLEESFALNGSLSGQNILQLLNLNTVGLQLIPKEFVFIALYLFIGLTTGLLCLTWHFLYLLYAKTVSPEFSTKNYIKHFWVKVYPLLWSSSSETLAVPPSLNLMKRYFPNVPMAIRQFVITGGSYLGINGTMISVYVMGIILAKVVGVEVSILQLLFSIPVIFILGYAVPGIPGELVVFAGSISILLGVPAAVLPLFLALYLTLQIGLPDAFRTGCNSTDNALIAIISSQRLEKMKAKAQAQVTYNATGAPSLPHEKNS